MITEKIFIGSTTPWPNFYGDENANVRSAFVLCLETARNLCRCGQNTEWSILSVPTDVTANFL